MPRFAAFLCSLIIAVTVISIAQETTPTLADANRMFDEPVLKAVRAWRFTPPVDRSGQKVAVYYRRMIAFNF